MPQKKIVFFGYHNLHGARAITLQKHYEEQGYTVLQCHTNKKGVIGKFADLRKKYLHKKDDCDAVVVMFAGHYLMPLAWWLTRKPRKTLIFDAFISVYDTLVNDRKLLSKWNPKAWVCYAADMLSTHLADEVLLDTKTHRDYFVEAFHLPKNKVKHVYLDAVSDLFFPKKSSKKKSKQFDVFFYGNFIPLQGVDVIIKAASLLQREDPSIQFTLVGSGQTFEENKRYAEKLGVHNVSFPGRLPYEKLPDRIRQADLCLGIFGTSDKASRVIPHKVYDYLACGMPVITMDSPGIRERFSDGKEVTLCERGNPTDLARKIQELKG